MIISDVKITGLQPLGNIHLHSLTNFNVLVGPNNSGKSTVLEAISKIIDRKKSRLESRNKEFYAARRASYTVEWTFNASIPEIFCEKENMDFILKALKPHVRDLIVRHGLSRTIGVRAEMNGEGASLLPTNPICVQDITFYDDSNFEAGRLPDGFSNRIDNYFVNYLGKLTDKSDLIHSPLISIISSKRTETRREFMVAFRDGGDSAKYDDFVRRFRDFYPSFPMLRHTATETNAIIDQTEEGTFVLIPYRLEGGGSQRAFQILAELCVLEEARRALPNDYINSLMPILLIDEPEISMHAELQRLILHELLKFSKNGQVFIATHSPIYANPGEHRTVIVLPTARTDGKVRYVEKPDLNEISGALGLRNRDYFLYNHILFLEGYTEQEFVLKLLDASAIDPFDYGIDIHNLKGVDKTRDEFVETIIGLAVKFGMDIDIVTDCEGKAEKTRTRLTQSFKKVKKLDKFRWDFWGANFESCFPADTLYKALIKCAKEYNVNISITTEAFQKHLGQAEKAEYPDTLKKIYHEETGCGLNKKQFGRCLAEIIIENPNTFKDNEVIRYLMRFFSFTKKDFLPKLDRGPIGVYLGNMESRSADGNQSV